MSAGDFRTRYASVMASVLESAVTETTKLFESMVDELKAEISRMKKENEDLKTRCSQFESARSQAAVDTRGSEPPPGRSDGSEKRDTAVQCDLVSFRTMLVEQWQPSRQSSAQNQKQQCGYEEMEYTLQEHNYDTHGEENSQMALILVKHEREEVEATMVCGQDLSDKADPRVSSAYGIEQPFINKISSTGEISFPQRDEETQDTTYCDLQGAQNQSSEMEHSLVISLAAIKDVMEGESEVGQKTPEVGTQGELITSEKQPVKEILQSPSSDISTNQEVNKSPAIRVDEVEVSSITAPSTQERTNTTYGDVENSKVGSLAVSVASLSRRCSSEKEKISESQQLSMDVEGGAIQTLSTEVSSATETLNTPPAESKQAPSVQSREQTSVTLQDAILLVEAMNQSIVDNRFSSPQSTAAAPQTQCAPHVGTSQTVDKVPAEPHTPPLPVKTHASISSLPLTELSRTRKSTIVELGAFPQTTDATPNKEAQALIKIAIPKQQYTVCLSNTTKSPMPPSTAATETCVQSLQQHRPQPLITSVAPSKRGNAVPHKIIVVPRSVSSLMHHEIAAQPPTQLPRVMSTVVAGQNTIPGSTAASLPLRTPSLSSVLQKKIYVTSSKSLPVVTQSTTPSANKGTLLHPKITIIIPRQLSAVASRKHQSQNIVLTAKQDSAKSAAPVTESSSQSIPSSHELSVSVDTQNTLDEVATISSQKRDDTLGNLESLKRTASVSETNAHTENSPSLNMSVGLVPASMSPEIPPTFEQKLSAVVRLTRLPFSVSTKESISVSRPPTNGTSDSQAILKEGATHEKPSSMVISTQPSDTLVLSTDICPSLKETSVAVSVNTSQMSEEPNDIQEKALLSSENGVTLEDSHNSRFVPPSTSSKVSPPVFEKSTKSTINTTEPSALSGTAVEPTSNLDEGIICIAVQDYMLHDDRPIEEKQSADLIHRASITSKDTSDPHLQMTKTQFLAQLAVSPVAQNPKQDSSHDSVDVSACAVTSTGEKNKLQKNSLMAQLRSHLKTHLQARRTETILEPHTETETRIVSPEKPRLENGHPSNKSTTSEPIPVSPKNPEAVEDVASLKMTTNDPTPIGPRRSGLCRDGVKPKRTITEQSSISSRRSKITSESSPVSLRRTSSARNGVSSITKKSLSGSPRTSISLKEISGPKNTKNPSVCPRRTNSIRDRVSPKNTRTVVCPNDTKTISASRKRTSSSRDGTSLKKAESTSVSPRSSGLSKNGTSLKMCTNESTSVSRRSCTLTKDVSSTKPIKRESISFSPRTCSTTTDQASTKNTKSEINSPSVSWPKLASVSPRKTGESTSAKKPRLIQDCTGPKKNLRVANAKKLAKTAKAKTIAKMKNSNQSKLQNGVKTSLLAENRASCESLKKCTAKAVWIPPQMSASETPPAGGKRSPHLPVKKETRSPTSPDHEVVYPHSVSLHPIPVKAPPIVSPLQPLSVIGRHLLRNQCGECGRVFNSSDALESHVSLHTVQRPFSCMLCGKRFQDSKALKRHGRVHRNGRIHVCQQCGKGFVYRFGLTKHLQMVHSRIKPFVCQICNKGFVIKRDVEAHIRMHTGEKPFHCNLCEKKFARRVELNVHLRWHNGEKRHWCPYCGKGFLDLNNLKRHKYIHTGEKPHSCPHCPKNFTQSGHLKKHVKNVHKIQ